MDNSGHIFKSWTKIACGQLWVQGLELTKLSLVLRPYALKTWLFGRIRLKRMQIAARGFKSQVVQAERRMMKAKNPQ